MDVLAILVVVIFWGLTLGLVHGLERLMGKTL